MIKSNTCPLSRATASANPARMITGFAPAPACTSARLASMSLTARGSRSTNVTCAAPRLSASIPIAPGPRPVQHAGAGWTGRGWRGSRAAGRRSAAAHPSRRLQCLPRNLLFKLFSSLFQDKLTGGRGVREILWKALLLLPSLLDFHPIPTKTAKTSACRAGDEGQRGGGLIVERRQLSGALFHERVIAEEIAAAWHADRRKKKRRGTGGVPSITGRPWCRSAPTARALVRRILIQQDAMTGARPRPAAELVQLHSRRPRVDQHDGGFDA